MRLQLAIAFFLLLGVRLAHTQSFTYSDTHPVSNLDSLHQWLATHPQPTPERLKNLISITRTLAFNYPEKSKTYLSEIGKLSVRLNNTVGKNVFSILSSTSENMFSTLLRSCYSFEALRDTSGMIYTLMKLCLINYDGSGRETGDKHSAKEYMRRAESLLQQCYNVHDYLRLEASKSASFIDESDSSTLATIKALRRAIAVCNSHPSYAYALTTLESNLAVAYFWDKNYEASYRLNRTLLRQLQPDQVEQKIRITQNAAIDCELLGRFADRLHLWESVAPLLRQQKPPNFLYLFNMYVTYKEELFRRGDFKAAALYGDSISMMQDSVYNLERSQSLLNFQTRYETGEKEKKIAQLQLKQTETESRNRWITTLLTIAAVVLTIFGFLVVRLRRLNAQLSVLNQSRESVIKIIAHDLRNPLYAFFGMGTLINHFLKKGDNAGILKLSQSIDQTGSRVLQMLDNLMYWAIAPKGDLLVQFSATPLLPRIEALAEVYQSVAVINDLQFTVHCPEEISAFIDPNAFDLILRNLIDNAAKNAVPRGKITIEVSREAQHIKMQVADNGRGMTAERLQWVRTALNRPNSMQPQQNGMGLGMIIVGKFAKSNHIRMEVESTENIGTTFVLHLPRDKNG